MQYNELVYKSGPNNFKDYVSDKYNIIHNQLYKDALYNFLYLYLKDIIMKKLLYNLFLCINSYAYSSDNIVYTNENNEIIVNNDYIESLINYIKLSIHYNEIKEALDDLSIENKYNYLKTIITNILTLLNNIKSNIHNDIGINDFSDFIIKHDTSIYMIGENNEIELFNTEVSNIEVFIYEEQYKSDYHIGFNKDGYFVLDIDPSIDLTQNYDKLYYIMGNINNMLIDTLIKISYDSFVLSNTIIEKPQDEYYLPSSVIIYGKKYPHKKLKIDLSPYWSNYQDHKNLDISDKKIINETINDGQIEDINYVTGKIKIYSKMNDIEYTIDSKYVGEDTYINDELIQNTFTNKIKNILVN